MRSTKVGGSSSKAHQPSSSAPMKRKSPKSLSATPKFTHFFFVLKNAKQLHQLTSHFISASVKIHSNFAELSSSPVLCHHSQADFQFAFFIDLTGSNVIDSPELFSPKITIYTNDSDRKVSVGTAVVPPIKSKSGLSNGRSIVYLVNHQDIPLKLLSSPKIGGYMNITCAFGSLDSRQAIEPSIDFIETSIQQLQRLPSEPSPDFWETDAIENGWVPPEKAQEIWQKIAREHGWRSPEDRNMVIQSNSVGDYKPSEPDNADLISFSSDDEEQVSSRLTLTGNQNDNQISSNYNENNKYEENVEAFVNFALASKYTIQTKNVFDQNPKRHQFSTKFSIFEMQPEWQPTDSDTDLNQDLTNLLTGSASNNLYEFQNENHKNQKNEMKK